MFATLFRSVRRVRKPTGNQSSQISLEKRARKTQSPSPAEAPRFNPKVQWWSNRNWLARYERHVTPDAFNGMHHHRILDRRFSLTELAKPARQLHGSTAECGVFKGIGSALICETLRGTYGPGEMHYAFDSFEGLPETGPNDAKWKRGDLVESMTTAQRHLAEFPQVRLVPGWLPETLSVAANQRFRLVHIDVDIEQTTRDCLEFFYPRAVQGAVFVFDDYGSNYCPGARKAVDEFLSCTAETLIELTTGQAVFFKK
jgi:hypothetical protein